MASRYLFYRIFSICYVYRWDQNFFLCISRLTGSFSKKLAVKNFRTLAIYTFTRVHWLSLKECYLIYWILSVVNFSLYILYLPSNGLFTTYCTYFIVQVYFFFTNLVIHFLMKFLSFPNINNLKITFIILWVLRIINK